MVLLTPGKALATTVFGLTAIFFVAWHDLDTVANHFANEFQYCGIDLTAEDCGVFFCYNYITLYKFAMALMVFVFALSMVMMIMFFGAKHGRKKG
jgi:hypothetical protein